MDTGYMGFVRELKKGIVEVLGYKETDVFFEEKGQEHAPTGDRLMVTLLSNGDGKEVCGIYTQELYENYYMDGRGLTDILQLVGEELERAKKTGLMEKTRNLMDYEKIKDSLIIRLLNKDKEAGNLKNAVFDTAGDIALVLYLKLGDQEGAVLTTKIRKEYLEAWQENGAPGREKIMEDALANTARLCPPRLYCWEKLIYDPYYEGEDFMGEPGKICMESMGNCISTLGRVNGAAAVFYPGVAEKLCGRFGSGFYIAFTSVHEVIVHNDKTADAERLEKILSHTLEEATPEEDILTRKIYHYDAEAGTFSCVETGKEEGRDGH